MGLGVDIKDVLTEIGSAYTIVSNNSGEYGDVVFSTQVTKPITIESFRRMTMPHDTSAVVGDVLDFDTTTERFLLTNKLYDQFENEVITIEGILYKCNVSNGILTRPSGEAWGNDYHKETQWEEIKTDCDAMQVAALYGNDLESDEELALLGFRKDEVYLPHSVGAQVLDRFQPASGEYYMVNTAETRRFPGVDVLIVVEDTR